MPDFGDDEVFVTADGIEGLFCVALDDDTFEEEPGWYLLDATYTVVGIDIDRGRSKEFDRTDAGTAVVSIVDTNGAFDPTNTGSDLFGRMLPRKQAAIGLQNPTDDTWSTIFRGFVRSIRWEPYVSLEFANVEVELVDGMGILAAMEMVPGGEFPENANGDIVFPADPATDAVQTRINDILDAAGWPAGLRQIFTGNVGLKEDTCSPLTSVLVPILDAADAEFPTVANFYFNKNGHATFHGRKARFDPDTISSQPGSDWVFTRWEAGDRAAAVADPTDVVPISPPLLVYVDDTDLYTSAFASYEGIELADRENQFTEATSVSAYGNRTWSAENLLTDGGEGATTDAEETLLFATYVKDNYSTFHNRVGQLTFRPQDPDGIHGDATWALMCGVDISDVVHLTTTHNGGGGFNDDFYIEGVNYKIVPMSDSVHEVTLTLDVSPATFYSDNPW